MKYIWLHITTPKHTYLLLVLYHPPKPFYNSSLFIERLAADIDELAYEYPDAIMYITGDFNRLNISQALTDTGLKSDGVRLHTGPTYTRPLHQQSTSPCYM